MNPTFKEIWFLKEWGCCPAHPSRKYKHNRNYYRFRSAVRIAFWGPLAAYAYYLVMASI